MPKMFLTLIVVFFALPTAALAHTGAGDTHGFAYGLMHPLGGLDHVLAMVAVGLFAAHLGGRALWLVPAAFVWTMAVAGVLGMAGVNIPLVEIGIAVSVIAMGLIVAFGVRLPVASAMALVGFFAIFHGHAHGAELPEGVSGLAYAGGFIVATALLHACGVTAGLLLRRTAALDGEKALQLGGSAMLAAGMAILLQLI